MWFTGLSGAGKSTLASALYQSLSAQGEAVELLDGDAVRDRRDISAARALVSVRLPADRSSTRRIDLVKVGRGWLVEEVRDQPSAAASTSRTSSSSKS